MITCDATGCVRGIVHSSAFGEPCKVCDGAGSLSLAEVCRRIDEWESVVTRILKNKPVRVHTAARICAKLVDMVGA